MAMYLCNFHFILVTFLTTFHYCNTDIIKSFGTAAKDYANILDMSRANIGKKTSLLDSGKLRSVSTKLLLLSKAAGPLVLVASLFIFEDVEAKR